MITIVPSVFETLDVNHEMSPSASSFRKQTIQKEVDKEIPPQEVSYPAAIKKSVTFGKRVKFLKIRSQIDFSQEEKDTLWYSSDEYEEIKEQCKATANMFQNDPNLEDCNEFSIRGLESRKGIAAKIRRQHITKARYAVLDEQAMQEIADINDPERIRDVYRGMSFVSLFAARSVGICDWEAAI